MSIHVGIQHWYIQGICQASIQASIVLEYTLVYSLVSFQYIGQHRFRIYPSIQASIVLYIFSTCPINHSQSISITNTAFNKINILHNIKAHQLMSSNSALCRHHNIIYISNVSLYQAISMVVGDHMQAGGLLKIATSNLRGMPGIYIRLLRPIQHLFKRDGNLQLLQQKSQTQLSTCT